MPLAIPNNVITKVQVRYYNECTGAQIGSEHDLAPLPAADQAGFTAAGGGMLWGLPNPADPTVGDKGRSFNLPMPTYSAACGDYVPVGVEVRVASRDDIDLNQACATLALSKFADCFHRLSQIRVWNDGNADSQPRIPRVALTGGCGGGADAYFSSLPTASASCAVGGTVEVNWGTRDTPPNNVAGNFSVRLNGTALNLVSWNTSPGGTAIYSTPLAGVTVNPGATNVSVSLSWTDTNTGHSWGGNPCRVGSQNPCKYSGTQTVHRVFVGTKANAGAVTLVRTSRSSFVGSVPGPPFDNHVSGGSAVDCGGDNCPVFPTVGIASVLKTGVFTVLRLDDPQANQTLECDPDFAQGQEFNAFQYGCKPWYAANNWTSPWWNGPAGSKRCPDGAQWFSNSDLGAGFGKNSGANPWRCVLTAPGMSTGQVGDDIAVATENCNNVNNNSCQAFHCNYDGNYDGKSGAVSTPWTINSDSHYPRVVNLFIVPYQGSKGLTGAGDTIPVLGFASFYVMNWRAATATRATPVRTQPSTRTTIRQPPRSPFRPLQPARSRVSSSRRSTTSRGRLTSRQPVRRASSHPAGRFSSGDPPSLGRTCCKRGGPACAARSVGSRARRSCTGLSPLMHGNRGYVELEPIPRSSGLAQVGSAVQKVAERAPVAISSRIAIATMTR
jgi:hypothetical protein